MISIGKICERNPSSSLLKGILYSQLGSFRVCFFPIRFRKQKSIARGNFGFFNFLAAVLALAFLGVPGSCKRRARGWLVQDGPQA